jgi:phosphopantothenoylcysteine decarboxylase/phosphopantothenate--cysteine ligase
MEPLRTSKHEPDRHRTQVDILITSGPTRQYLDPVRYLTNASSGLMGSCLAEAAISLGHRVTIVSGPVQIEYPPAAVVIQVVTTEEMLEAAQDCFPNCGGLIGVAAPCDYRPIRVQDQKIAKTGQPLLLHLVETPDIVASLGAIKRADQWIVGFALETEDHRFRALRKLEEKSCDLIILNAPSAMHAKDTDIEILDRSGYVVSSLQGPKTDVAQGIMRTIQDRLIDSRTLK